MTCPSTASSSSPEALGAYERHLAHLIRMAGEPGWKAYAWHRAQELDADRSGMWRGIAEALKTAMTRAKASEKP